MARASALLLVVAAVIALVAGHGAAFDPNPLQDFCVADTTSKVRVNGIPCKDPATVTPDDFFFSGVDRAGAGTASRRYGFTALPVQIPGLNTLGASHARVDTAVVLGGAVYFGFVSSYPDNKVYAKVLRKGDVFAVPQGLVHFLYNNGTEPASLYATLSSQNPGLVLLADALFGSGLPDDLLAKAFLTDVGTAQRIGAKFRA
ncbi:unnamed protein product [Urochloa decumbens]|uniref:Germin-like protein n=1 Tax=Urochloa decumbens TaxID=240449 RepID=A0ABC9BRJ4_9POAL